jgi:hydroxypyruvate reductase
VALRSWRRPGAAARRRDSAIDPKALLADLFATAVAAAAGGPALSAALERDGEPSPHPVWIIALGKAAADMAAAAVRHLAGHDREPQGGVIVSAQGSPSPHPSLMTVVGDHPLPGPGSQAGANVIGAVVQSVGAGHEAWVLLSGGATSLAAGPIAGTTLDDLTHLHALLLGSGLDIAAMNTVRKRFSRWGAGRLAVALHPAGVRTFIVSDVIGDDVAAIGSGPCAPDDATASDVRTLLEQSRLWERTPRSMRDHLALVQADPLLETPKSNHPAFRRVTSRIVANNALALDAARERAETLGVGPARVVGRALRGEAAPAGREVAAALLRESAPRACLLWGGETVVTIDATAGRQGGRCQELALAAARELSASNGSGPRLTLLAAGTDGRDGPTDAAGAIVDAGTWEAIKSGRDPEQDLANHDAYLALDAAGALVRTGLTGTNVMDIVIGLRT